MKYVKILGLLAVAAAALMAFAGTASATLTNANGTNATAIHASASGNSSLTGSLTITCGTSTIAGSISTNDANHVEGPVTTLDFGSCGSSTVTVVNNGSLTLTDSDGTTGTVYSKNAKVTVLVHNIFLGTIHCTYITSAGGTDIGTFTESHHTPSGGSSYETATLHISASIEREAATSDFGCGEHATWECTFEVISPMTLLLD